MCSDEYLKLRHAAYCPAEPARYIEHGHSSEGCWHLPPRGAEANDEDKEVFIDLLRIAACASDLLLGFHIGKTL
jgi:hypothetical protein